MEEHQVLIAEIKEIITLGRKRAYISVNCAMVETNWSIGRRIVEEEQGGRDRASYAKALLKSLSQALTEEFGDGFSVENLTLFRKFYLVFPKVVIANNSKQIQADKISYTVCTKSIINVDANYDVVQLCPELTWSHYRLIIRVKNPQARAYYINEAIKEGWSTRNLERNINSLYYERILSSQDKTLVKKEADDELRLLEDDGTPAQRPKIRDFIKDPFVLEFLDLPTNLGYQEKDLEKALISHMQSFLLELGQGFAFVARQQHIKTENSSFYIDLVFYNYKLKCFLLIDLKTTKLTHQDIGQMDMYVRMYDALRRDCNDNPTIGIILCSQTDSVVAKYSVLKGNEQLFASKYSTVLPTETELKAEIEKELEFIDERRKLGCD